MFRICVHCEDFLVVVVVVVVVLVTVAVAVGVFVLAGYCLQEMIKRFYRVIISGPG